MKFNIVTVTHQKTLEYGAINQNETWWQRILVLKIDLVVTGSRGVAVAWGQHDALPRLTVTSLLRSLLESQSNSPRSKSHLGQKPPGTKCPRHKKPPKTKCPRYKKPQNSWPLLQIDGGPMPAATSYTRTHKHSRDVIRHIKHNLRATRGFYMIHT